MDKYFVTTPIYYVNDVPHVGHAYTTIAGDVLARYWRKKLGDESVLFLTGTDEHGAKVAQAAKDANLAPKEFADRIAPQFEKVWQSLQIEYSHFFRTTDPRHEKEVSRILQKLYDDGHIYEGLYEGLYCEGCEKFLAENDLADGKCPLHPNKQPQLQKEKNYFFKLSSFKQALIDVFEGERAKIFPDGRKNEILGKLAGELKDVSISREGVSWGIPIPWDKQQTIYVWVEALFNYYTATRFLKNKERFWPADLHLIGKDILWFHTVIWCALLLAAKLPLPKAIFAHGFFTINGQKMSKSLGNVIAPQQLIDKFGADAARYLLLSEFPFGQDGDFSIDKLTTRYNADLANGFGNLVSRVAKLCEDNGVKASVYSEGVDPKIEPFFAAHNFTGALSHITEEVNDANRVLNDKKPWALDNKEAVKVLGEIVPKIQYIAFNIYPFLPTTSESVLQQFTGTITSRPPLFPRLAG